MEGQGYFKLYIVLFKSNGSLHTQSHIQLSVKITMFYPFIYHHSVLCCHFEARSLNGQAENRVNALPNPTSVQSYDKILIEVYENIRENVVEMSRTPLKISGKVRETFPQC